MRIFKIEKIKNDNFYLYESDIHHIKNVLRIKAGSIINASYENNFYELEIISFEPLRLKLISKKIIDKPCYPINFYIGVIDKKYFEIALKSLNEVNCLSLTPVFFKRSQCNIKYDYERLQRIIDESNKQSQRTSGIKINQPILFDSLIKEIEIKNNWCLSYENEQDKEDFSFDENDKEINVIIGPEGGITIDEYQKIISTNKVKSFKLTNTILRSETACLYIASVLIEHLKGKI